jgi:ribosomal protein S18 acetylase RimI-like enzyme
MTDVQLNVREADESDLPAIAELFADAAAAVSGERGGAVFLLREGTAAPDIGNLRQAMSDPAVCLGVGDVDDVALGLVLCRLEALDDGSRLARLEWMWVDPGARELGLGAELMDLVIAWAGERGATRLDAHALPGNREAKNFLERAGFSARLIVLHRALGDRGG